VVSDPYSRLNALGLVLPSPPSPLANYVAYVEVGAMLYVSGQGPRDASGRMVRGKVGRDLDVAQAYEQARLTGMNLLAIAHAALGDLGRVRRVVKLLGMVNAVPEFEDHPAVVNGCSDLLIAVFGDIGRHARSAVGLASLPGGIPVEIEAVLEVAA
jgi:enamine deaminase RidA (YjgF/YER057c/UK114 family)